MTLNLKCKCRLCGKELPVKEIKEPLAGSATEIYQQLVGIEYMESELHNCFKSFKLPQTVYNLKHVIIELTNVLETKEYGDSIDLHIAIDYLKQYINEVNGQLSYSELYKDLNSICQSIYNMSRNIEYCKHERLFIDAYTYLVNFAKMMQLTINTCY